MTTQIIQQKISVLQAQVTYFGQNFQEMIAALPPEVLHDQPAGKANSIAATIGHVLTAVDAVVNGMLKQSQPLFIAMPTGLSELPPSGEELFSWYNWGTQVTIDLDAAQTYAQAVIQSVIDYLDTLSDDDLETTIQTPVGPNSLFDMINVVVLGNLTQHAGEIAALKGLQGLKGYSI